MKGDDEPGERGRQIHHTTNQTVAIEKFANGARLNSSLRVSVDLRVSAVNLFASHSHHRGTEGSQRHRESAE